MVKSFFCSSLIFSEENGTKRQNLHEARKQNRLAREEVSMLTLSKNGTLRSKGCRPLTYKIRPCKFFKTKTVFVKTKTFDFFQDQDHKNGMRINSSSLTAIFL